MAEAIDSTEAATRAVTETPTAGMISFNVAPAALIGWSAIFANMHAQNNKPAVLSVQSSDTSLLLPTPISESPQISIITGGSTTKGTTGAKFTRAEPAAFIAAQFSGRRPATCRGRVCVNANVPA